MKAGRLFHAAFLVREVCVKVLVSTARYREDDNVVRLELAANFRQQCEGMG